MLYLDHAASSPIRSRALEVLETSLRENFANPSSAHKLGKELSKRIESCRTGFLDMLQTGSANSANSSYRFIFTSSATESNNTVINGLGLNENDGIIFSQADHPSITEPVEQLAKKGVVLHELPLDMDGTPKIPKLLELLDRDKENAIKLINLTHVNNQSGAITGIEKLGRQIKNLKPDIHIHVDAAQGFAKLPLSLQEKTIDSLCISSHKTGGPKGAAGLYLRPGVTLSPLLYGGGQEGGLRSSTQAAPLLFAFHAAALDAMESLNHSLTHVTQLNRSVRKQLKEKIPAASFPFGEGGSPYILTFLLPGISSDIILRHLEQKEIMISSTSACSSRIKGTNPVFKALHLPEKDHKFVLRASFSHFTQTGEVESFCQTLATIYNDLKRFIR